MIQAAAWTSLIIGLLGILAMTWVFPVMAGFVAGFGRIARALRLLRQLPASNAPSARRLRVAILIPAHNEEKTLGWTLDSISRAMATVAFRAPDVAFMVRVGADGCTDATAEVAREHGADVMELSLKRGKWGVIRELALSATDCDWVVLADAGIEWHEEFLANIVAELRDPSIVAVAPSYRTADGGRAEEILWSIERHFKALESGAGGPVSIHGATICYRRPELQAAFEHLGGQQDWLNDDVVLPLALRALFPKLQIRYMPGVSVLDSLNSREKARAAQQALPAKREFHRRRRLIHGNVQWIRRILPVVLRSNPIAGLISFRRVFRVLWAYWGLCFGVGAFLLIAQAPLSALAALLVAAAALGTWLGRRGGALGRLADSAGASLLAPYYFVSGAELGRVSWK